MVSCPSHSNCCHNNKLLLQDEASSEGIDLTTISSMATGMSLATGGDVLGAVGGGYEESGHVTIDEQLFEQELCDIPVDEELFNEEIGGLNIDNDDDDDEQ